MIQCLTFFFDCFCGKIQKMSTEAYYPIDSQKGKKKCQVFTPEDKVSEMLQLAGYNDNVLTLKVLENSFGSGNFLIEIVNRYIKCAKKEGWEKKRIAEGLSSYIFGVELDKELFNKTIEVLNEVVVHNNIPSVTWSLFCDDFLCWNAQNDFDLIIGNPPYLNYRDLSAELREKIRTEFNTCKIGKYDYYYPFIEHSYSLLRDKGKLVQLIPANIFKNVFGKSLRNLLLPDIKKIIEYPNNSIFSQKTVSSIFLLEKNSNYKFIDYCDDSLKKSFKIDKKKLSGKWVFSGHDNDEISRKKKTFGDLFDVSVSIATLKNAVFLVDENTINEKKLENQVLKVAISPRGKSLSRNEKIIFPYYYENQKLNKYNESEFKANFPNVYEYLLGKKDILDTRAKDSSALWFEYGRSQALTHLNQRKLLISTIVSKKVVVYELDKEEIPYSGIYIVPKKNSSMPLSEAKKILESNEFITYVKDIGTSVNGSSKRITCKDILQYKF